MDFQKLATDDLNQMPLEAQARLRSLDEYTPEELALIGKAFRDRFNGFWSHDFGQAAKKEIEECAPGLLSLIQGIELVGMRGDPNKPEPRYRVMKPEGWDATAEKLEARFKAQMQTGWELIDAAKTLPNEETRHLAQTMEALIHYVLEHKKPPEIRLLGR